MAAPRNKYLTLIALVAAMLLAMTGLAGTADAATARKLSTQASPDAAVAGTAVIFSGILTNTAQGSAVTVQRKSGLSWVKVVSTTTANAAGGYAVSATLPTTVGTYSYRATAPVTSTRGPATSATITVTALRQVTATLKATPATVVADGSSTLSGTVTPFVSGTVVAVQRRNGLVWTAAGTATISATGTFSAVVNPATTSSYRVVVPRAGLNSGFTSTPVTVTVAAAPVVTTSTLPDADQAVAYTAPLAKTGGAGTWAATGLPAGLSVAPATGVISGTPTTSGTFAVTATFTETATGLSGSTTVPLIVSALPTITTAALPDATRAAAYTTTLTKTGFDGTWAGTGLPNGLTVDAAGTISGTPVALGDSTVTISFTETATGRVATATMPLHVGGTAVAVTTTSLTDATKGQAYSATLTKTGGAGTWAITGLPAGLSVAPATGVISGTTQVTGDAALTVTFTETSTSTVATKALTLRVGGPGLAITTPVLPDATKGRPYSVTLTQNGGAGTWASYPLPNGLVLDTATGVLSGTPTTSGDFSVYLGFTDTATGKSAVKGFALHIAPSPVVTTTSLPDATTGTAYSKQLTQTGNAGTWAVTKGNLPAGVTLSTDGLLAGTATAAGDFGFTVTFTETTTGYAGTQVLLLHVSTPGAPVISTSTLPSGTVGTPYTATLSATGTGTWTLSYGTLPAGITLNGTTGVLSGTPTAAGDALIQVRFGTASSSNTKVLGIRINPAG